MKVLDLFSGIGGFSLGLKWAGNFTTEQFVEIDPYCRRVLAKHWPEVPIYDDINTYHSECGRFDVVTGGFPCQDISLAGRGAGIEGKRSGLWKQLARVIGEVGPRWAIIENVPALRSRGLVTVLQDICALGYDAEWHCVPASALGARHRRDRIWIIAYPQSKQMGSSRQSRENRYVVSNALSSLIREQQRRSSGLDREDASVSELYGQEQFMGNPQRPSQDLLASESSPRNTTCESSWWAIEPDVGRVAHGVPARVDRLRALGNAIVPQMAYLIGQAILEAERERSKYREASQQAGFDLYPRF